MPAQPVPLESVTVALELWNAADTEDLPRLEVCLRSLREQTLPLERCRTLILSGGDGPEEGLARQALPLAEVIRIEPFYYYRCKNVSLLHDAGYVACCDSDVRYEPSWLEQIVAYTREHGIVTGYTRYEHGFLSRPRTITDAAMIRTSSGRTRGFFAHNLCVRGDMLSHMRYDEGVGRSGAGAGEILRDELERKGIATWFCKEARAWHDLAPLRSERLRFGAFAVHARRYDTRLPGGNLIRVAILGPLLVVAGSTLLALMRAWRLRSVLLRAGAWSLPLAWLQIVYIKSLDVVGACLYAAAPRWLARRTDWFVTRFPDAP